MTIKGLWELYLDTWKNSKFTFLLVNTMGILAGNYGYIVLGELI
jgi:hypothetical protein